MDKVRKYFAQQSSQELLLAGSTTVWIVERQGTCNNNTFWSAKGLSSINCSRR